VIGGEYVYFASSHSQELDLKEFFASQPGDGLHFKSTIQQNLEEANLDLMNIRITQQVSLPDLPFLEGNFTEIHRYYSGNVGHTLGDDAFAIFRGLDQWGLSLEHSNLNIFVDNTDASHPLELVTKIPLLIRPIRNVCLQTFFGGWQGLGFVSLSTQEMLKYNSHDSEPIKSRSIGASLRKFRDAAWKSYGINGGIADCITLVFKDITHSEHPAEIYQFEELSLAVANQWNGCVQKVSWHGMPMEKQVRLVSRSRAMFSLPGSDCMNAVFLPDDAVLVLPERRRNHIWEGSNEYRMWFKHVEWLKIDHYRPESDQDPEKANTLNINISDTTLRLYSR